MFADGLLSGTSCPVRAETARLAERRTRSRDDGSRAYPREGEQDSFADVELDLDWCTPFQRAAVEALAVDSRTARP